MAAVAMLKSVFAVFVPIFPERVAFGQWPWEEVLVALLVTTSCCSVVGYLLNHLNPLLLTRIFQSALPSVELRDEVWEDGQDCKSQESAEEGSTPRKSKKRTGSELLFIVLHNGAVTLLAALSWLLGVPTLALYAFCLEVAYEIFDSWSLGRHRMEPETLIHHVVSPICILCSTQTDVDYRVLCHLCICIDFSGALLGLAKFLLRFSHIAPSQIYRKLFVVYALLRVVFPLIDTAIIVSREIYSKGGLFGRLGPLTDEDGNPLLFAKTDWTQLYFWAMAVLNAFNIYFCVVIRSRARLPPQVVANYEARMSACN